MDGERAKTFEGWVIVELFGHKRMAGYLRSQEIPGGTLPCVDVPSTSPEPGEPSWRGGSTPAYSKMLGVSAIYGITPVDEATARRAARILEAGNSPLPLSLPGATAAVAAEDDGDDDLDPDGREAAVAAEDDDDDDLDSDGRDG